MARPTVALLGTLDTKGAELAYLRDRLDGEDVDVLLIDVGTGGPPTVAPDVTREEVARAGGIDLDALVAAGDRGASVSAMGEAAAALLVALHAEGRLLGVLAAGGTGNSSIAATAMQALPIGVPKLLVSTVAAGDTTPYVGAVDLTMMAAVTDVAGVNSISARILANAAGAIAGMVRAQPVELGDGRPLVAASMFGVTTAAVEAARTVLEAEGYEVLTFHATGAGGRALERLAAGGFLAGVLDLTTTELADDLVGGVLTAGPDRLTAAGAAGLPQVVSVGALDMVNFGPRASVPERFADRQLLVHNPTVTLMRTTPQESAELGRRVAAKLAAATGETTLFLPLRGISAVDVEGGPFRDPEADDALFAALREGLAGSRVDMVELDLEINDDAFARTMAERLHAQIGRVAA